MYKNESSFMIDSLEHLPNPYISLNHVGWDKCKPGHTFTNYRNMYLVHFVRSGKGVLEINGEKIVLKANDAFLIRPNQLAIYTADEEDPWEYYFFAFTGLFAAELVQRTVFKNGATCATMPDDTLFYYIYNAATGIKQSEYADIYGLEQLFKFLSQLMTPAETVSKKSTTYMQYIKEAQAYIDQNFAKPIRISDIAKSFNLNRSHFYRIFKDHTGLSMEQYLANTRIEQAKKLLCESELPISSIAELTGYKSYSTFHAMFKKTLNVSPGEYRAKQKSAVSKIKGRASLMTKYAKQPALPKKIRKG